MATPPEGNAPPQPGLPPRMPLGTIALWLVVVSLAFFAIPLYLIYGNASGNITRLQGKIRPLQATLVSLATPLPESQQLLVELARIQDLTNGLRSSYANILSDYVDWPAVMQVIGSYDPGQVALSSITQAENRLTLHGLAANDAAVVAYARALEASNLFSRVVVQSIKSVETPFYTPTATYVPNALTLTPQATLTPTLTLTPTATVYVTPTATLTPTLSPSDAYEPDDWTPAPIALGQPQAHNFYPVGDIDKVTFLAKAGHFYHVFTSQLAPGVDTVLTVLVGNLSYTNDDRANFDLSSEVFFQNNTGYDLQAVATVANRGIFGSDKSYLLTVEEVAPTPTPAPLISPTPTLAATPSPTADLRDQFEPDDTSPVDIILSQPQQHNFYPQGDVDRVKFTAKAGRIYHVYTSQLAPGVDTVLQILVGATTYVNDDRAPGDPSSEITFQVPAGLDQTAYVTVLNRGFFGSDKSYTLTAEEFVPTPTLTVTATPDRRDNYEPDDLAPKDIFFGQPQLHNFYPTNDIDKVQFLAKAGHFYRVSTSNLSPGVDTILAVQVGSAVYTSDDRQTGDLSSDLIFRNDTGVDTVAVVTVSNRGAYGPDKLYTLAALELSDQYEPDDVTPKPIQIAETQTHSFFPQDDIDKVVFLAKAGRTYDVSTSNLSAGVDTIITASLMSGDRVLAQYTNDDRRPGDPSSEILFRNGTGADVNAVVTVSNRGAFGPDKQYQITVQEATPEPITRRKGVPGLASEAKVREAARFVPVYNPAPRQLVPVERSMRVAQTDAANGVEFVIIVELKVKPR